MIAMKSPPYSPKQNLRTGWGEIKATGWFLMKWQTIAPVFGHKS